MNFFLRILLFASVLVYIEVRALQSNFYVLNKSRFLSFKNESNVIKIYKTLDLVSCLATCNSFCNCSIVYYTQSVHDCQLYKFDAYNFITTIDASEENQVLLRFY